MNLQIYQAYYKQEQIVHLDPAFIPYDNTINAQPHLREYPMWQKLYENHKDSDAYWGLMSWLWFEKTKISSEIFKDWILENLDIDMVLDRISQIGINSLTKTEKEFLDKYQQTL
jgi:hypothetical protein